MRECYLPESARYIHRFEGLLPRVPEFIEGFDRKDVEDKKHKVFLAWVRWQSDGAGDQVMRFGAPFFYERFMRAIEDAQQGIEMVVRDHTGDHRDQIEPFDEIGSCNDPDQLIRMYDGERFHSDYRADALGRFEITRKLTIASQIMCIAAADPYERVTSDLTRINILAGRRLFGERKCPVLIGFVLDKRPGRHNRLDRNHEVRVSLDTSQPFVWPSHVPGRQRVYVCRVIDDAGRLYFVQTDSRPKPRISGVIKIERGGRLSDRRALKHILVAVQEQGILRPANREDVERVVELARMQLWIPPLREESDVSGLNVHSHPDYWALKIVGRFESVHEERLIAASVEHQVTSIENDINAEFATDALGHKGYRQKVVREFILPQWFPEPLYGISWTDASVQVTRP
jgi:hypothetical protein